MNALCSVRRLLLICLLSAGVTEVLAQQNPVPAAGIDAARSTVAKADDTRLINLPVVVRDKKGTLIDNLTKEDLTLQVDGKPEAIRFFGKDPTAPLRLGLLVDTSAPQSKVVAEERAAAGSFLDRMLAAANDQAFVGQFSRQTELLQDLTSSHPLLQAALKEIDTPSPSTGSGDTGSGSGDHGGRQNGGALYDALFLTSDEIMHKQAGRKAVILLSDGVDSGSKETLAECIEAAQRANVVVYAIYFKADSRPMNNYDPGSARRSGGYPGGGYPGGGYPGGGYPGGGYPGGGYPGGGYPGGSGNNGGGRNGGSTSGRKDVDGKKVLQRMAQETGGRLFEAKKSQDVAPAFDQIAEELHAQYRLSFLPDSQPGAKDYHQVDLSARRKDAMVQTRDGYYAAAN